MIIGVASPYTQVILSFFNGALDTLPFSPYTRVTRDSDETDRFPRSSSFHASYEQYRF